MKKRIFSFSTKLILLSGVFSAPILTLFHFMINEKNKSIDFTTQEIAGNEFLRPIRKLFAGIVEYRLAILSGTNFNQLEAIPPDVSASFAAIKQVENKLGQQLQYTPNGLKKRGREHLDIENIKSE